MPVGRDLARHSGRLQATESTRVLDDAARRGRLRKQLDALEQDNFHEDPHAQLQWHKNIPRFDDEQVHEQGVSRKRVSTDTAEHNEGTTTVSDCRRSHVELRSLNYSHLMVNHSLNFVDPQSLVCTNHIECVWQKFKHGQKSRYGTYRSLLSTYVEEYVWRQKISGPDTFNELWKQIKKHYPCSHCRSGLPCSGKRKKKFRAEHSKQRFRKNFLALMEDYSASKTMEGAGWDAYSAARAPSTRYPARRFCAACGFFANYTCIKCGARYCSVKCRDLHNDTRCMKWTA